MEAVRDGVVISTAWIGNHADVCCVGLEIKLPTTVEFPQPNLIWC